MKDARNILAEALSERLRHNIPIIINAKNKTRSISENGKNKTPDPQNESGVFNF